MEGGKERGRKGVPTVVLAILIILDLVHLVY